MEYITIASVCVAIISGVIAIRRSTKQDDSNEASKMTTVIVKLENIGTGIAEIKSELNNVKADIKDDRERLIVMEQSVKQAWHQIDEIKKKVGD